MEGHVTDGVVEVGPNARERYYDSRGYGQPRGDGVALSRVEAAHLLYRGDLDAIDGREFAEFLTDNEDIAARFLVYKDLRERGFYLSVGDDDSESGGVDFLVHPRGEGPWDGTVEHRVRVVGERTDIALKDLGDVAIAVVDEESEITYLDTDDADVSGGSEMTLDDIAEGRIVDDRVVCWTPPAALYEEGFYGQQMCKEGSLQLSLLEATHLAREGHLIVDGGTDALIERGRALEGDRFDCRLWVYCELRKRGLVPKTGFKFGADFRVYERVDSVAELGHSELLVRVLSADRHLSPRDLALDVRLAHGVRKRMVFALVGEEIRWLSVARLTP